jgi:hypothetical protein
MNRAAQSHPQKSPRITHFWRLVSDAARSALDNWTKAPRKRNSFGCACFTFVLTMFVYITLDKPWSRGYL